MMWDGLICVFIGGFFLVVVIGMITHALLFGSVFWTVAKTIETAAAQRAAAQQPRVCGFCGRELAPRETACPSCGAPCANEPPPQSTEG